MRRDRARCDGDQAEIAPPLGSRAAAATRRRSPPGTRESSTLGRPEARSWGHSEPPKCPGTALGCVKGPLGATRRARGRRARAGRAASSTSRWCGQHGHQSGEEGKGGRLVALALVQHHRRHEVHRLRVANLRPQHAPRAQQPPQPVEMPIVHIDRRHVRPVQIELDLPGVHVPQAVAARGSGAEHVVRWQVGHQDRRCFVPRKRDPAHAA